MNQPDEQRPSPLEDRLLDRLVDGELTEAERRTVLSQLETDPLGWRRCALAFLEAQAWRETFGSLTVEGASSIAGARLDEPVGSVPKPSVVRRWGRARLAAAAGLLLAFTLGFAAGGAALRRATRQAADVQVSTPPAEQRTRKQQTTAGSQTVAQAPKRHETTAQEPGRKSVPMTGAASRTPVQGLPVLTGQGLDELLLRQRPPALPAQLLRQWERRGYHVEKHRRLISMDLKGGGRLAIPVDEVRLHYVGQRAY
ncbi:MAG TPA: hypothetical protein VGZ22_24310 [Isosphaeraceae bacterium]|jgi:anti-sigma factor RsiW|nr:hypothetical protein [Isosphaeraceae bacterium]